MSVRAVSYWPTREQALQARAAATPCEPRCDGVHTVADVDPPTPRGWQHPSMRGTRERRAVVISGESATATTAFMSGK
jgi:hypothetical protein